MSEFLVYVRDGYTEDAKKILNHYFTIKRCVTLSAGPVFVVEGSPDKVVKFQNDKHLYGKWLRAFELNHQLQPAK